LPLANLEKSALGVLVQVFLAELFIGVEAVIGIIGSK
jgi:hypothetical protein